MYLKCSSIEFLFRFPFELLSSAYLQLLCFYFIVAKLRSQTSALAAETLKRDLLLQYNIRECFVNLGARVDAYVPASAAPATSVRSSSAPVPPLSDISMAQFNQEILLKSR